MWCEAEELRFGYAVQFNWRALKQLVRSVEFFFVDCDVDQVFFKETCHKKPNQPTYKQIYKHTNDARQYTVIG